MLQLCTELPSPAMDCPLHMLLAALAPVFPTQVIVRVCVPPPQVDEHVDQGVQDQE